MQVTVVERIEYLKLKAKEMREAADQLDSPEAREAMLTVAHGYETLAEAVALENEVETNPAFNPRELREGA